MSEWTHKDGVDGIKKQAQELIYQAYQKGYKAGQENALVVDSDKFREQGRNEAWDATRKIFKEFSGDEMREAFGKSATLLNITDYSASEAIEKIRAYEEQKKQEEDEKIKVGDEVQCLSVIGIVTHISEIEGFSILWGDGSVGKRKNISDFKKTGRTFPQIVEVLKKLQEVKE